MGSAIHLFTIAGMPVYASIWYFVLVGYFAMGSDLKVGLLWGVCISISILIHELGHALVARHFRLSPAIILHGWGGLCAHERADRDRDDALIIAAGPLAGLVFGGLVYAVRLIAQSAAPELVYGVGMGPLTFRFLIYINLFWSLINLIPFWPLDGGQLFRLALLRFYDSPAKAERHTHLVGIAVGGTATLAAMLYFNSLFLAIIAVMLTFQNVARINATAASGPIRTRSKVAEGLLAEAQAALEEGNFREAARLAHQIRADTNASGAIMGQVWEILAVAAVHLEEFEEADSYAQRAPQSDMVLAARAVSAINRQDREAASVLLEEPTESRLREDHAEALRDLVGDSSNLDEAEGESGPAPSSQ